MATPYRNPSSGVYYIRVEIPADVRAAFGGKTLHQKSLGTRNVDEARLLFQRAHLALIGEIARVRRGQIVDAERARTLVRTFLDAKEDGHTRGATLLRRVEADAFMMGLTIPTPQDGRQPRDMLKATNADGHDAWRQLLAPVVERVLAENRMPPQLPPDSAAALEGAMAEAILTYRLEGSLLRNQRAERLNHGRRRKDDGSSRLRPDMLLIDLFDEWKRVRQPSPQTTHEYKGYVQEFITLVGNIPATEVTADDPLNYRDEAASLPASMSRADRALPFPERAAKFAGKKLRRISPASTKKRVGALQALLGFAFKERWIAQDVGRRIAIEGYSKNGGERRYFLEDELGRLFSHRLFTAPASWSFGGAVADSTLFWMFLLGATAGTRIEETGQALLADCGVDGGIGFIDITDYVEDDVADDIAKSLKTEGSRRLIPVHGRLREIGFDTYVAALRAAGATRLFPDLSANQFDKLTQEASRRANRIIDAAVSDDPRLVFHSLRHTFKSLGRDAAVPESILDQICGHVPVSVGGQYGRGARLKTLRNHLAHIDFSAIAWDAILEAARSIDWVRVAERLMSRKSPEAE